jgi:predicted HicB family RNase H-like nuclease
MPKQEKDSAVLYIRQAPRELAQKLKAAAALQGKSLQSYLLEMLQNHVSELERKGMLPKGK